MAKKQISPKQSNKIPKSVKKNPIRKSISPKKKFSSFASVENIYKRLVVIDGCNVGFGHSHHRGFSVEGVEICLNFLSSVGHNAIAVVPQRWVNNQRTSNPNLLRRMEADGKVLVVPYNNQYGSCSASYDDHCILKLAVDHNAAVISNDHYRDVIDANKEWRNVIENRVITFTFFKNMIILPVDPYGPNGPSLHQILNSS